MKKALLILLAATGLTACSKNNDVYPEQPKRTTSSSGVVHEPGTIYEPRDNKAARPDKRSPVE